MVRRFLNIPGPRKSAIGALLLYGSWGRADSEAVNVRLELVADPACATRTEFTSEVSVRSERIRFVDSSTAKLVRAEVEAQKDGAVFARLTVFQPNGKAASRELRARSCAEAVDALALVAAVTLDPLASGEEPSKPAGERAPEEPVSSANAEASPPPRATGSPPRQPLADAHSDSSESSGIRAKSDGTVAERFGISAAATWGPAPGMLPGVSAYFELSSGATSVWSPSARASVARLWRGGFETEYGTASFALTALTLDLCPIALRAGSFDLRPCGALSAGLLQASGSETEARHERVRPWSVLGLSALLAARVTERVEFSAVVAGGRALVRDRFQFAPDVFHEVPPLAFSTSVGAGFRFP